MRLSAIVKVDSKGRITIPQSVRNTLGIETGMLMLLIADIDKKEIYITPIITASDQVYGINVTLVDRPGALAKVSSKFAEYNVDIIATRCTSVIRGEEGTCLIVADFSRAKISPEKLREALTELDDVIQVKIRKFEAGLEEI